MFNYLNSILYKSKTEISTINDSADFQPFMAQRWCTMHSLPIATIVNETTNKYWPTLEDKNMWYIALDTIIPRCKFKKISYIKKFKKDLEAKEKEHIQKIANTLEISSREIISYMRNNNLELPTLKNND